MTTPGLPRHLPALIVGALLLGAFPWPARASTYEVWGADARAAAMGGTQTALSRGGASNFYNPARLSLEEDIRLDLDLRLSMPTAQIQTDRALTEDDPIAPRLPNNHAGFGLGVVIPFSGLLEDRAFFGLSVYLPAQQVMIVRALDPAQPFLYLYDSSPAHIEVIPALSIKWWDFLSTGFGLRAGGGLSGPLSFGADFISGTSSHQEMDTWMPYRLSPTAGISLGPFGGGWGQLAFGLDYRESLHTPVDLESTIPIGGVNAEFAMSIDAMANFTPRTVTLGMAYLFGDRIQAGVDLQYAFWSEAPDPAPNLFLDVRGDDLEALGLEDGLDVPQPGRSRNGDPAFSDTLNFRMGLESQFYDGGLILRGGYGYRPTPIPAQTTGTNFVDSDSHQLAIGVGSNFSLPWNLLENPLELSLTWQSHVFSPRSVIKESPDDPVGDWRLTGAMHNGMVGARYLF
jgi:hypothetical protein